MEDRIINLGVWKKEKQEFCSIRTVPWWYDRNYIKFHTCN